MKFKGRVLREAAASLLAVFLLLSWGTAPMFAQGITDGTIAGTVTDPQGAVVSNAKVTAKNNSTGQVLTASASDDGTFRINNVPVGYYTVTIEAPSFKTYSNADVQVQLNRVTDVNAALTPGNVSEIINVTAGAAAELVETTTSQLGKSFESRQLIDLPISGDQNFLALLAPNVVTKGAGVLGSVGSVGGNRPRNNSFTLDGIDNNDISVTGPQVAPIGDAVKEFTILTNQFTAEFGHSSAGQFNTITKTGTNTFHADLWWYNQNKNLNALDHRLKETAAASGQFGDDFKRPRFDFNRIGADAGGRIIKDKLFWFGAFQYQTTGTAGSTIEFTVPTAQGFAILQGLGGVKPFPFNILKTHVPPAGTQEGSVDVFGTTIPVGQLAVQVPSFNNLYQWQANVDYVHSDNDRMYGRILWDRLRSPLTGSPGSEFTGDIAVDNRLIAFTENHNFSSRLVNELRLGYRRQVAAFNVPVDFPTFPSGEFPNIIINDLGLQIGPDGNSPQSGIANVYQGYDALNWTKDRHQFKFGFTYYNAIAPTIFLPRQRGEYQFENLQDFLSDLKPEFALKGVGSGSFAGNQQAYYFFAQDDFKLKPNFTLNLGVRYEYTTNARDAALQEFNKIADVEANDPILAQIHQELPGFFPNGIHFRTPETDKNNWAPRLGFAWAPEYKSGWLHKIFGEANQSSIRGGFGIAYDVLFQNLVLLQLPPQFQQEIDATSGNGGPFGTDTNFLSNGGIPSGGALPPEFFTDPELARAFTQGLIFDTQTPYTISWSLAYQREIMKNTSMELRYLGTRGVHLFIQNRLNGGIAPNFNLPVFFSQSDVPGAAALAALPTRQNFLDARHTALAPLGFLSGVTGFPAAGNSEYNAVSINVKRRFTRGFLFDASYTFSKTIDDSTNELFSSLVNPRRPQDFFNIANDRGISVLDRPHRFVASWIWELPFYRGERSLLGQLLGNWQLSGVYQAESGQPFSPLSQRDVNGNGDTAGDRTIFNPNGDRKLGTDVLWVTKDRSFVPIGSVPSSQVVGYVAANPNAAWIRGDAGALATVGRNVLRAAAINNFDITISKKFLITERHSLNFRAEMFNAFNHPQYTIGDATFGSLPYIIPSSDPGNQFLDGRIYSGNPRVIQLVLRYSF
jgi:Carboxypeptidase regulatory-like domain